MGDLFSLDICVCLCGPMDSSHVLHSEDPGSNPSGRHFFFFKLVFICTQTYVKTPLIGNYPQPNGCSHLVFPFCDLLSHFYLVIVSCITLKREKVA